MFLSVFLLVVGLALLIKGADWLINGASSLAKRYNVSDLTIGLTIVAFGTSAPELVINSYSAAQGHYEVLLGNIIGSNNFNLFIILGISGLITPLVVQSSTVWKELPFSLFAAVIVYIMANDHFSPASAPSQLIRSEGLILLTFFLAFLGYIYYQLKNDPESAVPQASADTGSRLGLKLAGGLAGLTLGGHWVVSNAVDLATQLGMSEEMIGLTILAAGTSLPELATSITAATKKNNDIAVGNIIGSNIFNLLLVLGISALIAPINYSQSFNTDLYILTGGTLFLFLAMFTGGKKRLDRWEAFILLSAYLVYWGYIIARGG